VRVRGRELRNEFKKHNERSDIPFPTELTLRKTFSFLPNHSFPTMLSRLTSQPGEDLAVVTDICLPLPIPQPDAYRLMCDTRYWQLSKDGILYGRLAACPFWHQFTHQSIEFNALNKFYKQWYPVHYHGFAEDYYSVDYT
jgi:hypothetical protein